MDPIESSSAPNLSGFQLNWSQLSLQAPGQAPWSLTGEDQAYGPPRLSVLGQVDASTGYAFGQNRTGTTMGSALASVVTAGVPLSFVGNHSRFKAKHYMLAYFRGRGALLVWRMKF